MNDQESEPQANHRRVLIVEDERRLRDMLVRAVAEMEFEPAAVSSGEAALETCEAPDRFGIVVLDLNLPGIGGIETLEQLREIDPHVQAIILTGYGDLASAQRAIRLKAVDFLTKPCRMDELENALDAALRHRLSDRSTPTPPNPFADPVQPVAEDNWVPEQPKTLQEMERERILAALGRNEGNRNATARELGISVRTLYYRLAEYERNGYLAS